MVALLAGISAHMDPMTTIERGGISFVVGWVAGLVWEIISKLGQPLDFDSIVSRGKASDTHTE